VLRLRTSAILNDGLALISARFGSDRARSSPRTNDRYRAANDSLPLIRGIIHYAVAAISDSRTITGIRFSVSSGVISGGEKHSVSPSQLAPAGP
jgi:hypothetical protein